MTMGRLAQVVASAAMLGAGWTAAGAEPKTDSAFYPAALMARGRENADRHDWAAAIRDQLVKAAEPWARMGDEELWSLMFGHTITRSWMVWSNGHCPACRQSVTMYNWEVDALGRPWKVRCPHCRRQFPTNDFKKFYDSGLDEHGVFDPKRADRSLLFNADHPDPADPLRGFGVDDGEGYVEGDKRWRFIGAYLIYGQWKQAIVDGMRRLADAYVLTGDLKYAHKAGILLDRVADLYPEFDFAREGKVYEVAGVAGYVSTWHDSCWETRDLILTWDMILPGVSRDASLPPFLAAQARRYRLANPKASFADIRRNVEDRILVDCQKNSGKIRSNYPQTDITLAFAKTALAWPESRDEVNAMIAAIVNKSTAVDGTTGENGLSGYSAMAIRGLADLLSAYARMDPAFLPDLFRRAPRLHDAFRFHIDAWCLQRYYPSCGDAGAFCSPAESVVAIPFSPQASLTPSMYTFAWQLYQLTGDERFAQALYHGNQDRLDDLPHDLFADDPVAFREGVKRVIDRAGKRLRLPSVNKRQWHLGLLRSGDGEHERVLWLDYDSGGPHSHHDGMNLGLFAKGLDLMPDFGYPPVQYGGWGSPRGVWYTSSLAHNTVVVDGKDTRVAGGTTTWWADGAVFHGIQASCPALVGGSQYERTAILVDTSDRDSYVLDVFRVAGGTDHARFVRSHFGTLTTRGVPADPAALFPGVPHMRRWQGGAATPGWSADWKVNNAYQLTGVPAEVHVRHTDLTADAEAYTGETWVSVSRSGWASGEAWVPHVVVHRRAASGPLKSTFVSLVDVYEEAPHAASVRRLPLKLAEGRPAAEGHVALEIRLADGRRDLFVSQDPAAITPGHAPATLAEPESGLAFAGQACLARFDAAGRLAGLCLAGADALSIGDLSVRVAGGAEYVELALGGDDAGVLRGDAASVKVVRAGRPVRALSRPAVD